MRSCVHRNVFLTLCLAIAIVLAPARGHAGNAYSTSRGFHGDHGPPPQKGLKAKARVVTRAIGNFIDGSKNFLIGTALIGTFVAGTIWFVRANDKLVDDQVTMMNKSVPRSSGESSTGNMGKMSISTSGKAGVGLGSNLVLHPDGTVGMSITP